MSFIHSSSPKPPSSWSYTQEAEYFLKTGLRDNDLSLVQKAISLGVDLTAERTHFDGTPLLYACKYGCTTSIVKAILEAHASPHSGRNCNPLHYAIKNPSIVSLLIKAKANVEKPSISLKGERPLHTATRECEEDTVKLLLEAHADPQAKTFNGSTALRIALTAWHNTDPHDDHILQKYAGIFEKITTAIAQWDIREKILLEAKRTALIPCSHSSFASSSSSSMT